MQDLLQYMILLPENEIPIMESYINNCIDKLTNDVAMESIGSSVSGKLSSIGNKIKKAFNKIKSSTKNKNSENIREANRELMDSINELDNASKEAKTPDDKKKVKIAVGAILASVISLLIILKLHKPAAKLKQSMNNDNITPKDTKNIVSIVDLYIEKYLKDQQLNQSEYIKKNKDSIELSDNLINAIDRFNKK